MRWRYRLLCWLGWHHWVYSAGNLIGDDLVMRVTPGRRCCLRCGKLGRNESTGD